MMSEDKKKKDEIDKNSETLSEKKTKEINLEEKLKETEDKLLRSLAEIENQRKSKNISVWFRRLIGK